MIEKEFVPYELALELKQLGFNEPCLASYETAFAKNIDFELGYIVSGPKNYVLTPLYQQAFRWFREQYNLCGWVKVEYEYGRNVPTYCITGKRQGDIYGGLQNTYEEAELACLKKLIEIVSNSKVALQK